MMMENTNNLSSYFPITFFDGERELDMGKVQITPSLTFKQFQSILSNLLHISPHQITIYFQRHNNNNDEEFHHHHNHHWRRHPVTSKFDFDSILNESQQNSSFFWVVQKRSRRTRRRKPKSLNFNDNNNNGGFVLLRRNDLEYANRMRMMMEVERERERYLMSMNLNSNVYDDLSYLLCNNNNNNNGGFGRREGYNGNFSDDGASSSGGTGSSFNGYCDVCYNNAVRGGETVPFHWCKNDAVTKVFRSPAGPIAPPKKMNDDFQFFG